jgi:spore coat polysaccharide biosynthesis protein SpsF
MGGQCHNKMNFMAQNDSRRIVAIIQARMGSKRLPGKVLARIGNSSLLTILIHRLKQSGYLDSIVVATTTKKNDDAIVELAHRENVRWHRGSDQDVLGRYCETAKRFNADVIVRVTADNPLTDPELMDRLIESHLRERADYTCCPDAPLGTAVEIIDYPALNNTNSAEVTRFEREHVTAYIRLHPDSFDINVVESEIRDSRIRLTVDTAADLTLMNELEERIGPLESVNVNYLVQFVENNPKICKLNTHIALREIDGETR